jgi:adenylylsulfate kinase
VREIHEKAQLPFIEVYVKASIDLCEKRDVKGLYKKARSGLIKDFTGVNSVYEEPWNPEITLDTEKLSIEQSVSEIIKYLDNHVIYLKIFV